MTSLKSAGYYLSVIGLVVAATGFYAGVGYAVYEALQSGTPKHMVGVTITTGGLLFATGVALYNVGEEA